MAYEQQTAPKNQPDGSSPLKEDLNKFGKVSQKLVDDSLEGVRENLSDYYHKSQEKLMQVEKKVEGAIRQYPLRSLAAAAGVGFLIGLIRRH